MLIIDPWCCYFAAVLMLIVPINWMIAAVLAALVHELWHAAAILLLGERIYQIQLHPWGMTIEASFLKDWKELVSALAGPLGSLSLVGLCHVWPNAALCGFVQGFYNLLPVYPLDGGRVLRCILKIWIPKAAERICTFCANITMGFLLVLAMTGIGKSSFGILSVFSVLFLALSVFLRKIPCKGGGNRVQ